MQREKQMGVPSTENMIRVQHAGRLADVLSDHHFTAGEVLDLSEHVWQLAESLAKVPRSDDATKTLVWHRLTLREELEHTDGFEGLPSSDNRLGMWSPR